MLDGISLLPFAGPGPHPVRRSKPIGFWWGSNKAWVDNDLKIVAGAITPGQGCALEPPYAAQVAAKGLGPFLYNLTADPAESSDLSSAMPAVYARMNAEFLAWQSSVAASADKNGCPTSGPPPPLPPPPPGPSHCAVPGCTGCLFTKGTGGFGGDRRTVSLPSRADCCTACRNDTSCTVAVYEEKTSICHIKDETKPGYAKEGYWACRARMRM